MEKTSFYIINSITIYRLVMAPVLVFLILFREIDTFKWLLAISFFTDAIDGWLARRFKVTSVLGARIDSVADDLTILAAIFGMIVLKPDFFYEQIYFVILLSALAVSQITIALIRYGKLTSFHTYAAKVAAVAQGLFLISLFFFPDPILPLFYLAVGLTIFDLAEEILLVILLPKWKADVKGLFWVIQKRRSER